MTSKLFSELGLSAEVLKAIDKLGFEQASPIQAEAIPVLMEGHDVVGQSMTGSGKTAAFAVPAIEKVDATKRTVQALVLCPTRELAVQVSEEFHKLVAFKRGLHVLPIYGGQSYERQFQGLKQGVQIVIGTPGRVMDHMRRGTLKFDDVKMVILDEADVMLNMGFRDDIEVILQGVPKERQTVFFSATMPKVIQDLIQKYARTPKVIKIEQKELTVPTVEQVYYEVDRRFKIELLTRLIDIHDLKLGIIFCNTKRMVDELVDHLNAQGYSADRLHGDMSQAMRDRVMTKFRKSGLEFLVATDVAARGIDVNDVQVVFNYDLPYDPEDYVHRIGRTGRAGRSGVAFTFVAGRELFQVQHIERFTKVKMRRGKAPTRDEVEEARTNAFVGKLRVVLQGGTFKRQDQLLERLLEEGFNSTDIASALMHLLQSGEGAPTVKSSRDEEDFGRNDQRFSRDDRGGAGSSRARDDRGDRFDRDDRSPHLERSPFKNFDPNRVPKTVRKVVPVVKPAAPSIKPPVIYVKPAATVEKPAVAKATPATPVILAPKPTPVALPPRPTPVVLAPKPTLVVASPTPSAAPRLASKTETALWAKRAEKLVPPAPRVVKPNRRTTEGQTRLFVGIGSEAGLVPSDLIKIIQGQTGLPAHTVGEVDMRERHSFVDVAVGEASGIISKLNRTQVKGIKLKVKPA